MATELSGKVALVTGGAQGQGRATALALAAAGAAIAVNDIQEDKAAAVAREIEAAGGRAVARVADVADYGQVSEMVASIESALGPVGILVNNAGGVPSGARFAELRDSSMDDIQAFIVMNLVSMFGCTRAVVNQMIEQHYGKIICVSSIAAELGQQGGTAYAAAKAGITGFVASLSKEVAHLGVNVNAVMYGNAPHPSRTPERQAELDTWSHLRRVGRSEEFAQAVLFLASEQSSYVTGTTLVVDGGIGRFALL